MRPIVLVMLIVACTIGGVRIHAQPTAIRVHDPVMAKHKGTYYLFATGRGIAVWSSIDLTEWKRESPVFNAPPAWTIAAVPTFKGHFWAPDISYHNGQYYLYYSVSAFGKNTSCIGLATNVTLDHEDPRFEWKDRGKIIQSYPGITNWNAIDPNVVEDDAGTAYLSFGSFWGGLKMIQLAPDRMAVVGDTLRLPTIASRIASSGASNPPATAANPKDAGGNAIEAPFIFKKKDYYYLFASIDYCCKGLESTYKMIVGRSTQATGPYVDDHGTPLASGGGKLLLAGDERWQGVGHNSVYTFDGEDYLIFHGYDGDDNGVSKLRIARLAWDEHGWPELIN